MIDRTILYDMEYLRSEMELKLNQAKQKNLDGNYPDAENKIKIADGIITHIYKLHEFVEQITKEQIKLDFINKKLLAEILILKNKQYEPAN